MKTIRYLLLAGLLVLCAGGCAGQATESSPGPTPIPSATPRPITPAEELGLTGTPVDVEIESYRLVLDGLVDCCATWLFRIEVK
jgi:hypothetical protein